MTKEFDARNEEKSRSVCAAMAEAADTGKRVLTEREREILDMWPKFEDGEPVMIGDEVNCLGGEIVEVYITENEVAIWNSCANHMHLRPGERVERPAPKVLDADGVEIEVGDTVWTLDGLEGVVTKVEDGAAYIAYESDYAQREEADNLTHARPDSWERLEEDARKMNEFINGPLVAEKVIDAIIRRAKKLAGVE